MDYISVFISKFNFSKSQKKNKIFFRSKQRFLLSQLLTIVFLESMGPWTRNIAKVMYKSNTAMMIRIHVSLNIYPFAREGEFIGFIQFTRKYCGNEFINRLAQLMWDENDNYYYDTSIQIFDFENVYHYQYRYRHYAGIHSSGVIQYYRRLPEKHGMGNHKRNTFFLSGIDINKKIQFS